MKPAILSALTGLVLLGVLAALSIIGNGKNPRAAGMMPEVVVTAPSRNMIVDTVVVRPTSKNQVAGTMPDRSELN